MLIGELAKAAGVSKDTIRHYESLQLLISSERTAGSRIYRDYAEENIERVQMIRGAKDMGFSLKDVQRITQEYDAGEIPEGDILTLLRERLQLVREKIAALQHTEKLLVDKLKRYE